MSLAKSEIIWLQRLFSELGVYLNGPTSLYVDNTSAIQIARTRYFMKHTKYIKVNCHFIHQHVITGSIKLPHVSSKHQLVDLFTKVMSRLQHDYLTIKLMISCSGPHKVSRTIPFRRFFYSLFVFSLFARHNCN